MRSSRRMWARRMLRAGWLLAPILSFPGRFWRYYTADKENFIWCSVGFAALYAVGWMAQNVYTGTREATPAQITEALKGDWCMADLMPRRQEAYKRPLMVIDISRGKRDCAEAAENDRKIMEQQAAMKAAK